jgi:hypothetical protein
MIASWPLPPKIPLGELGGTRGIPGSGWTCAAAEKEKELTANEAAQIQARFCMLRGFAAAVPNADPCQTLPFDRVFCRPCEDVALVATERFVA